MRARDAAALRRKFCTNRTRPRGRVEKGTAGIASKRASASESINASMVRLEQMKRDRADWSSSPSRSAMARAGLMCPPDPPAANRKDLACPGRAGLRGLGAQRVVTVFLSVKA